MFDIIRDSNFQAKVLGALAVLVLAGNIVRTKLRNRGRLPLPPGPPGHWLLGNVLPKDQSRQFAAWVNQYGPVISLRVGSKIMIIIGRYQESVDIMEKESALLADRPRLVGANEVFSRGLRMILSPAGERFRKLRKAAHTHLQSRAAESYEPIQMQAASDVILDILNDPKRHQACAQRFASSVVLRVAYGKSTPTEIDAPEIVTIHKMLGRFQTLMRPGTLLEIFPILKHVPFYTRHIEKWRQEEFELFHNQLDRVASEVDSGKAGPSFVRYLLENQDTHQLSKEEMAYLAGSLFGAGSDTTSVAIMVVIMAAACNPGAQAIVQDELDEVIGRERAPTFNDFDSLPQVQAFMLECLRWRPPTAWGLPHRAMADIRYKNYCIPEGSIVFGNHMVIARDPEVYPNPDKFDPRRWLNTDGKVRDDLKFPVFGYGRRVCPGQHVARRSVFINVALLMWSFRITQDPNSPIDEDGFVDGLTVHPKPFDACFTPRIADKAHLREVMTRYAEGL